MRRATLSHLAKSGPVRRCTLRDLVGEAIKPTAAERRIVQKKNGGADWEVDFGWDLSNAKAKGLMTNEGTRGSWRITPAGERALDLSDDDLYDAY